MAPHTRAAIAQELPRTPGLLHDRCPARYSLRPRGLAHRSPITRTRPYLPLLRSKRSAVTQNNRSRGYVSDSRHTPFTSLDVRCLCTSKQRFRAVGSALPTKASSMPSAYPPSQSWLRAWLTDHTGSVFITYGITFVSFIMIPLKGAKSYRRYSHYAVSIISSD